jgi:hypothetical protein
VLGGRTEPLRLLDVPDRSRPSACLYRLSRALHLSGKRRASVHAVTLLASQGKARARLRPPSMAVFAAYRCSCQQLAVPGSPNVW